MIGIDIKHMPRIIETMIIDEYLKGFESFYRNTILSCDYLDFRFSDNFKALIQAKKKLKSNIN